MFDVTHVKHKELIFLRKMLLKLHFEVLYRRILFVMSIVYYFGDPNHGIPRATASIIQNNDAIIHDNLYNRPVADDVWQYP